MVSYDSGGSSDSRTSKENGDYLNSFQLYTEKSTPKTIKVVLQLLLVVFITALSISTTNFVIGSIRHEHFEEYLELMKHSYEKTSLIGSNNIILRILSNIANEYEMDSN